MKRLLLISLLLLPVTTSFAADLKLFQKVYIVEKVVGDANEAMVLFNNEKVLAQRKLGEYEYKTFVKERPDGKFTVKYIFRKKGK
jgi:hypothetical protein